MSALLVVLLAAVVAVVAWAVAGDRDDRDTAHTRGCGVAAEVEAAGR